MKESTKDIIRDIADAILKLLFTTLVAIMISLLIIAIIDNNTKNKYVDNVTECTVESYNMHVINSEIIYGNRTNCRTMTEFRVVNELCLKTIDTDSVIMFNPKYVPSDISIGDTVTLYRFSSKGSGKYGVMGDRRAYRLNGLIYE